MRNNKVLAKAVESGQFDVILARYNITQQDAAKEVFPLARSMGVGTICMKALAGGALGIPSELEKFNVGVQPINLVGQAGESPVGGILVLPP